MSSAPSKRGSSIQQQVRQQQIQQQSDQGERQLPQKSLQRQTAEQTSEALPPLACPKSPFGIEEVVYEIVSYLGKSSLLNCILVSKVFYRASIRVLWTSIQWRNPAWTDSFLSEFDRYGHYAVELHESYTADLERIARVCTNLRELRLNWTPIDDEKLAGILQTSPKITSLFLHSCRALTSISLRHIANHTALKHLEIKNMVYIGEPSFVILLKSCPLLEHLTLEDVRLERVALNSLGSTPLNIRTLTLTRSSPPGSFVRNLLRNAPMIKEFSMARNVHSVLSKGDLLPLQGIYKHISNLNLESCKSIDGEAILSLINACPGLERVNMSGTNIDDAGLESLATHCTKMTSLDLAWCAHVTDEGLLRLLGTCTGLKFLDISTFNIISAAIFDMQTPWVCLQLETLIIIGINMTRPRESIQRNHVMMFNQLSRLESLQDLAIGGVGLVLELEAGLDKMEKLGNLESFRIKHLQTALGEDEIRWLVGAWPKLKRVRFESESLPHPWFRYFRKQRPHLVLSS